MTPDFLDLLRALLAADARFMIVGAYAVGVHGRPRATKDLDVWVEASAANAPAPTPLGATPEEIVQR